MTIGMILARHQDVRRLGIRVAGNEGAICDVMSPVRLRCASVSGKIERDCTSREPAA